MQFYVDKYNVSLRRQERDILSVFRVKNSIPPVVCSLNTELIYIIWERYCVFEWLTSVSLYVLIEGIRYID